MKIIINATNIRLGGSVQVTCSVLEELRQHPEHEYHVFLSPYLTEIVAQDSFPSFFIFYTFDSYPLGSARNMLFFSDKLSRHENTIKPDIVFSVFGPTLWRPKAPHLSGFANVILFDEAPYTQRKLLKTYAGKVKYHLRRALTLSQLKKEADIFWVETELARKKLAASLRISPDNIQVVSNNYGQHFEHKSITKLREGSFSFLYLSSYYPHKNFEILNEVIPLLRNRNINCKFYLTLKDDDFRKVFPALHNDPMIINVGPVKPNDCPALYNKVDGVFIPTFLEFFSASYPEAMVMKKPIITSDLDFAHDICGEAALYFDPFDAESIAVCMEYLINNPQIHKDLIDKGLERLKKFDSAAERAEKLLNVMKDYLNKNS